MMATKEQWISGGINGESRGNREARFNYNRAFASGKQPMQEYLDILDVGGALSVINLAYDPLPIAIPFLNRTKSHLTQRDEKIVCNAIDPLSSERKKKSRDNAVFKLNEGPRIAALQEASGMHIEDFKDDDPESEDEIDIEYGFNYKEREEVIMENGIELVFYENNWDDVVEDRILDDTMNCGYAPVACEVDGNGRIKLRNIKPENFISSYSEANDFNDWQYQGEAYMMSIMDIRQMYPNKITEQKLFDLAKSQGGKNGNGQMNAGWDLNFTNAPARPYDTFKVEVINVTLKTLNNIKYEVSEDQFGKEVLDRKRIETEGKSYVTSPAYYVSYTGVMISENNLLLKWGLSENMIKPEENLTEIYSPYVVYMHNNTKMGNTPLIETMIPSIKIMQLTWLQQQKIIAQAAPDGYKVDIATMSDISLGEGMNDLSPYDLYKIYKQTGIQYYKSVEDDGEGRRQAPIEPTNVPFSGKLDQLREIWNAEYDKLIKIVGSNSLDSGQISNQAVGKEVLQNARQMGESASTYINNAKLNVKRRVAKLVSLRLWDILIYGKKFGVLAYDGYKRALGTGKVEYLRLEGSDLLKTSAFDVMIQVVTDEAAQAQLNTDINTALAQKLIEFYDAVDIRRLATTDIKYASYLMAARIKRRKKEAQETALANSKANTEQAQAAAQAKSQGDIAAQDNKAAHETAAELQKRETQLMLEQEKFTGILKAQIAQSVLAKEGGSVDQIPSFVFEGLPMQKAIDHATAMQYLQTMQQAQQVQAEQGQQGQPPQQGQAA